MVYKQINVRYTTPAATLIRLTYTSRFVGDVKFITVHWPAGCAALVEVAFGINARSLGQVWPLDVGPAPRVALDDATKTWPLNVQIKRGENFWIEIYNFDASFAHTPSVILDVDTTETVEY